MVMIQLTGKMEFPHPAKYKSRMLWQSLAIVTDKEFCAIDVKMVYCNLTTNKKEDILK